MFRESELPVNIGIDWKPALNLVGYSGFWSEGGFSSDLYSKKIF